MFGIDEAICAPLWAEDNPYQREREPLAADATVDVLIVGAGYTGLWTAFHLLISNPGTRVMVIDAETVGFGASGRNGGWCSAISPVSMRRIEALAGRESAIAFSAELVATVERVGAFCRDYNVDAQFAHEGWTSLARSQAQLHRVRSEVEEWHAYGFGESDMRVIFPGDPLLPKAEETVGGLHTPHCASVHPARLVHGLANVVESLGATIHHHTAVNDLSAGGGRPQRIHTTGGTVTADVVVRATEGFTASLPTPRREIAPIYSLMIASEPLEDAWWDELGWTKRFTLNDARRLVIYGQRTADGRLAFGGRGAPYHFGSAVKPSYDLDRAVHRGLGNAVDELFPIMREIKVTHRWGGPLGVARDWCPFVRFDAKTGFASAGGYVGDGVATSELAGRTLAELIDGTNATTRRWWVNRPLRRWEPEPLRWLGISAGLALPEMIDEAERFDGSAPIRGRLLDRLTGH